MSNPKPYSGGNQHPSFSFPPSPFEGQRVSGLGRNYEFDGDNWHEIATQVTDTTAVEYGTGLSLDESSTPPIVNLQPAQTAAIGGIMEPPADGQSYARSYDGSAGGSWVPVAGTSAASADTQSTEHGHARTALVVAERQPEHPHPGLLWWEPKSRRLSLHVEDAWVLLLGN